MTRRSNPRPARLASRRLVLTAVVAAGFAMLTLGAAHAGSQAPGPGHGPSTSNPGTTQRDIAEVRAAVARYHTPARAQAADWDLVPGLDHCFDNLGVGAMGYHYIDTDQLGDPTLDPRRPEALVFVESPNGNLRLGAVEYIVPIADPDDPGEPPSVLGHQLHQLEPVPGVHVWGLHVWLFERNPDGMFADWNPRVTCPV